MKASFILNDQESTKLLPAAEALEEGIDDPDSSDNDFIVIIDILVVMKVTEKGISSSIFVEALNLDLDIVADRPYGDFPAIHVDLELGFTEMVIMILSDLKVQLNKFIYLITKGHCAHCVHAIK